jgi:hypothetical protein
MTAAIMVATGSLLALSISQRKLLMSLRRKRHLQDHLLIYLSQKQQVNFMQCLVLFWLLLCIYKVKLRNHMICLGK